MSDSIRPPARQRRKEARPQELTAAALSLFVEKGFAATRLDDIAELAGVSKGTLYLYFESKDALFKAVIQEGIVSALHAGEALFDEYDDPLDLLRTILQGWWERIGNTELGGIPKLMMSEARNFPDVAAYYQQEVLQRGTVLLRKAVMRGIERGVFRQVDTDAICSVLIAPLVYRAMWRQSFGPACGQETDTAQYLRTYFDLILNGLLTGASGGDA